MKHLAAPALLALAAGCTAGPKPSLPENVVGHCTYTNNFSSFQECREYRGTWTKDAAAKDCEGQESKVVFDKPCEIKDVLAWCLLENDDGTSTKVWFPGTNADDCGTLRTGCEIFAGGYFDPAPTCGGDAANNAGTGLPVFRQPELVCKAPIAGEPAGKGPDGQVCTWQIISGATEEGRSFSDYADCSAVRTQRPYYGAPEDKRVTTADARMNDPAYVGELEWVRSQARASACTCCHASSAPKGASNWNLDTPGNFINGFHDRGIAMGAGWINTAGFGAYPKEQNNGFLRPTLEDPNHSIVPTTDSERMVRFFVKEAEHRSLTKASFANEPFGAGPLDDQRFYKPAACANGEGVGADGKLNWRFGGARYVYVLEAGATSPTVPPNLDLPEGTIWRLDVPRTGTPVTSGSVKFGAVPAGLTQKFPAEGAPAALVSGREYYLYVLADIVVPITRCVFKAP